MDGWRVLMSLLIHCSGGAPWLTWLGGRRFVAAAGTEGELDNPAGSPGAGLLLAGYLVGDPIVSTVQ